MVGVGRDVGVLAQRMCAQCEKAGRKQERCFELPARHNGGGPLVVRSAWLEGRLRGDAVDVCHIEDVANGREEEEISIIPEADFISRGRTV